MFPRTPEAQPPSIPYAGSDRGSRPRSLVWLRRLLQLQEDATCLFADHHNGNLRKGDSVGDSDSDRRVTRHSSSPRKNGASSQQLTRPRIISGISRSPRHQNHLCSCPSGKLHEMRAIVRCITAGRESPAHPCRSNPGSRRPCPSRNCKRGSPRRNEWTTEARPQRPGFPAQGGESRQELP